MSETAENDDADWLDLMAGRAAPEADTRTRKEAAWLRAALLSYRVEAPPGAPADAAGRAVRLLERARAAGVLADRRDEPVVAAAPVMPAAPPRKAWRSGWSYALASGAAAFGALLVFLPGRPSLDAPAPADTLRGTPTQRIEAADAPQHHRQLLQQLRAAGFDAQPYERLGRAGIDIALPVPLPAAQAAALRQLGLEPPAGPSLQIEVVDAAPAPAPVR